MSCPVGRPPQDLDLDLTPTRLALKGERGHCRARIAYGSHEITLVLGVDGVVWCAAARVSYFADCRVECQTSACDKIEQQPRGERAHVHTILSREPLGAGGARLGV